MDLEVTYEIKENIYNDDGDVIGVSGTQTLKYTKSDGSQIIEIVDVNWEEDATVEGPLSYEFPAQPEEFDIIEASESARYDVTTTHSETGISIHPYYRGRSEGCILSDEISADLQTRLENGDELRGEILEVIDSRSYEEKNEAEIPYPTTRSIYNQMIDELKALIEACMEFIEIDLNLPSPPGYSPESGSSQ